MSFRLACRNLDLRGQGGLSEAGMVFHERQGGQNEGSSDGHGNNWPIGDTSRSKTQVCFPGCLA